MVLKYCIAVLDIADIDTIALVARSNTKSIPSPFEIRKDSKCTREKEM